MRKSDYLAGVGLPVQNFLVKSTLVYNAHLLLKKNKFKEH